MTGKQLFLHILGISIAFAVIIYAFWLFNYNTREEYNNPDLVQTTPVYFPLNLGTN